MQDLSPAMFDEFYFELKQNKEIYNLQEDFIFLIGYSGWALDNLKTKLAKFVVKYSLQFRFNF